MSDGARGTVVFDLDGTLVDSAPDLAGALDVLMEERGFEPFGVEATRSMIGHGMPALVAAAFGRRGGRADDDAVSRFVALYAERLTNTTRPYPGAAEAIAALGGGGWRMVVCTNKREASARAILSDLGLAQPFAIIAGPDTFGVGKPDPEHLRRTLPGDSPAGHRAVMVGDSEVDVATARAAEVPVIACAWGYSRVPARELGADRIAERFDQVPDLVEELVATARPAGGGAPRRDMGGAK